MLIWKKDFISLVNCNYEAAMTFKSLKTKFQLLEDAIPPIRKHEDIALQSLQHHSNKFKAMGNICTTGVKDFQKKLKPTEQ